MKKLTDLLQISRYGMGDGDEELALKLLATYLKLINDDNRLPAFITFYNKGVKVLCSDSPFIASLKNLEDKGVKLIACTTCLNYYGIEKLPVGIKGTMPDIITLQSDAHKVISL
ncbi:DsrE family protein [Carboxylicivirga marina]|uniref:DsrE family protein n=1 Tax=Carboxylicivirga marina TaxID=2800988 RepID=A0ABS1HM07_9BACT|nr:DsrE family protein [Carboxylicivirga marina]MBK3518706.1 DsrE family protein [Carboxylicivirga marina]